MLETSDTSMFLSIVKAIGAVVNQTYSKVHGATLICEIKTNPQQ